MSFFWFFLLDASSNSDETSRHREQKRYRFLLIYIQFFPVLYKTGYFLLHITMIMMYLPTVLSFFGTVSMAILAVFFLQQCFCKLASTSGWILPSTSKLSDCKLFVDINVWWFQFRIMSNFRQPSNFWQTVIYCMHYQNTMI